MMSVSRFDAVDWVAAVVSIAGVFASIGFAYLVMPSVIQMFRDFGGELPLLTRMVLSRGFLGLVMLGQTALMVGGVALRVMQKKRSGRILLVSSGLISLGMLVLIVIGTYMPIFALADSIRE